MLHPPSPVAGPRPSAAPVMADDPVAVILDGPVSRELGRDRQGLEDPPVRGSLADWVLVTLPGEPGKPLSRRFWAFWRRSGGIRDHRIACNARTRPPEG